MQMFKCIILLALVASCYSCNFMQDLISPGSRRPTLEEMESFTIKNESGSPVDSFKIYVNNEGRYPDSTGKHYQVVLRNLAKDSSKVMRVFQNKLTVHEGTLISIGYRKGKIIGRRGLQYINNSKSFTEYNMVIAVRDTGLVKLSSMR